MAVEFLDFSIQVKEAMNDKALQFLEEAASEIESAAKRKSRADTSETRGQWTHIVDESAKKATVGNPVENAIWEEFGTGEYADGTKPGRKGGWYVPESELTPKAKKKLGYRTKLKDGKYYYHTYGKTPNHTLQKAFESRKAAIIRRAKQLFGELGK